MVQTPFVKFYEDYKLYLQGPRIPTNTLQLPEILNKELEEHSTEQPPTESSRLTTPLIEPHKLTNIEIHLPQTTKQQKEEFQIVDDDDNAINITKLVIYLVTKAAIAITHSTITTSTIEPNTFKQALKHPQKDYWLEASFKELQQLLTSKTFYFINRSKALKNPITNR